MNRDSLMEGGYGLMDLEEKQILALIEQALLKKPEAFESLVQMYEKKAYLLAYRLSGNPNDALEMSQEIFIKLYRNLSSFRKESSFNTWFYRLATNVSYDYLRKRQREDKHILIQKEDDDSDAKDQADLTPWPEELFERKELQELMHQAMWLLRPDHREVLYLYDIENHSYEEIAELLDCQLGTVKSRLHRARNALKQIILDRRELFEGYLRHTNQKGGSGDGM